MRFARNEKIGSRARHIPHFIISYATLEESLSFFSFTRPADQFAGGYFRARVHRSKGLAEDAGS